MAKKQPHYCGECCWHHAELTDGELMCIRRPDDFSLFCDSPACRDFCSTEQLDAHLEQMQLDIERGYDDASTAALRFAVDYINQFKRL